jgi:hypothetical protein
MYVLRCESLRLARHVACIGKKRHACRIMVGKLLERNHLVEWQADGRKAIEGSKIAEIAIGKYVYCSSERTASFFCCWNVKYKNATAFRSPTNTVLSGPKIVRSEVCARRIYVTKALVIPQFWCREPGLVEVCRLWRLSCGHKDVQSSHWNPAVAIVFSCITGMYRIKRPKNKVLFEEWVFVVNTESCSTEYYLRPTEFFLQSPQKWKLDLNSWWR